MRSVQKAAIKFGGDGTTGRPSSSWKECGGIQFPSYKVKVCVREGGRGRHAKAVAKAVA